MSPKVQRIGIFVIAIVMIVGTLGGFAAMVLTNENVQSEQARLAEAQQQAIEAQQKQADELSAKYYPTFKEYQDDPAAFDAASVGSTVTFKDLKEGTGETLTKESTYKAYYIGWNPSGKTFDSSFNSAGLNAPLDISPNSLIAGWYDGTDGMRIGGIREITIPSALAYGDSDRGEDIPPNTPLKFIIMAAEKS